MQMYVLSSMPTNKQSIAGSLLQTLTRLCTAVGFGIATAIFDAVENKPSRSGYYANNAIEPFAAVFWFAVGCAFIGTLFVPFLKIGTQGHKGDTGRVKTREGTIGLDDGHTIAANEKSAESSLTRNG
jgi:ABC-type phosphate transport system permease subunit